VLKGFARLGTADRCAFSAQALARRRPTPPTALTKFVFQTRLPLACDGGGETKSSVARTLAPLSEEKAAFERSD